MRKTTSVSYILDTRTIDSEGYGTLKIRVTHDRQWRAYTIGVRLHKSVWTKFQNNLGVDGLGSKVKDVQLIQLYNTLFAEEKNHFDTAKGVIDYLGDNFSFDSFKIYFEKPERMKKIEDTSDFCDDAIIELMKVSELKFQTDDVATANGYICSAKSLMRFLDSLTEKEKIAFGIHSKSSQNLPFSVITLPFLKVYEKWMLSAGRSPRKEGGSPAPASKTTIGIYLRNVRSIYNIAISKGIVSAKSYPFDRNGYSIPKGRKKKNALDKKDIEAILAYKPTPNSYEERSWSLWVFSYLSNGMNFSDLCRLKKENVDYKNNQIRFNRKKTDESKKNSSIITTKLFPQLLPIIEKYGDKTESPYLFPFLNEAKTEVRIKSIINQVIKNTNKNMKTIAETLGIDGNLETSFARHSFATTLLRNNVPLAFISEHLGHGSFETTKWYLGGFEDEQKNSFLETLL